MNSTIRTLILVTLVAVGAFAGSTVASSHASITASPATPDETATHTATVTVENGSISSLDGFSLDYRDAGVDLSELTAEHIVVGIDRGADSDGAEVDENVTENVESVETSNDGMTLNITVGGSTSLSEGDEVVVQIQDVRNPEAGEYTVPLEINPQSSGGDAEAMLSISDSENGTEAANETETGDETETETGDETETEMDETETEMDETETEMDETETEMDETETEADDAEDTETEAGGGVDDTETIGENETITEGPGFGVVVAVLAMLGAALLVARRQQ